MKKNALTNAVIAGIAGVAGIASVANAVNLNPDGLGQVLIYPYYTVNGGNQTLVSVVNTTEFGKAVKVRFVEGRNSREVLDFNLYLSPYDVWTGGVFSLTATGAANLTTNDNSCTVPAIKTNTTLPVNNGLRYVAFRNYQYNNLGVAGYNFSDAGPNGLDRTREGHLEMIEMGIVLNAANGYAEGSLDAITHDGSGVPDNCPQVVAAWAVSSGSADYWSESNGAADVVAPTVENGGGGLFGSAAIVDFANGTQLTYSPDAIDGFTVTRLHKAPGTTSPSLADANFPTASGADATVFDNGSLIQTSHSPANAIDAVSAVYMHDAIFNEYAVLNDSTGTPILASEWVVTFPTKNRYVDKPAPAILPFQNIFAGSPDGAGKAPVDIRISLYNREENNGSSDCLDSSEDGCVDFSPSLPGQVITPQLYWEAQVVTFDQPSAFDATFAITGETLVLGSKLAANVQVGDYGFTEGWMKMRFWDDSDPTMSLHLSRPDAIGQRYTGMPVTGFWAENTQTTSVLANFAGIWRHKASRCVVPSGAVAASACPTTLVP